MKKFLPLLPAFLLCFAGGMSLLPEPVAKSTSLMVTSLPNPPEAEASYEAWVKAQEAIPGQLENAKNKAAENNDNKKKKQDALALIEAIKTVAPKYITSRESIDWCNQAENELNSSKSKHDAAAKKLGDIVGIIEKEPVGNFGQRMDIYKKHKELRLEYDNTLNTEVQNLKDWYNKKRPPEEK